MPYLLVHRQGRGGFLPQRRTACEPLPVPDLASYRPWRHRRGQGDIHPLAFVRLMGILLKDPVPGPRIVPIIADVARTSALTCLLPDFWYGERGQVSLNELHAIDPALANELRAARLTYDGLLTNVTIGEDLLRGPRRTS